MAGEDIWNKQNLENPHGVADKASRVRNMFNSIAARYERTNTICSAGRDTYWRGRAIQLAAVQADDDVLDVACGTGDLTRALGRADPRSVVGCDFAHEMLLHAVRASASLSFAEADAMQLPFQGNAFSLVTCAFGVRNFVDLDAGLREMVRVLQPGGRAVILEFSRPKPGMFRNLYEIYSNRIKPWAASRISRDHSGAYRYLPRSVVSFPDSGQMVARLEAAGFVDVLATPLTLGVVNLYRAIKPGSMRKCQP